jgi:cell division FtsZ-interacting protein ZapD
MKIKRIITTAVSLLMVVAMAVTFRTTASAATDASMAPIDWAFTESGIPLHDAILATYPTIDTNTDGYISISEANAYTGRIILTNKSITGTIEGIENFTQITSLRLDNNQLTGTIPASINNLSKATELYLSLNQLTGEIPSTIGDLNVVRLYLQDNQLSGSIPTSIGKNTTLTALHLARNNLEGSIPLEIGNLTELTMLSLATNQLSGGIPSELGELNKLRQLDLDTNQLSGELPDAIYNLPVLERLKIQNNENISGNPFAGFVESTTLTYLDVSGTSLIQARPNIPTLQEGVGTFIYDNLAANLLLPDKLDTVEGLTQEDIDNAQKSCDYISDPTEKQQWQDDIDLAQSFLDAKQAVEDLFTDTTHSDIPDDLTLDDILAAEDIVNTLPEGTIKTGLLEEIEKAKNMLQVKEDVDTLFTDETHSDIPDDLTLEDILDVESELPSIPDGPLKDRLQTEIDKAKDMLNAKEAVEDLYKDETTIKDDLVQEDIDNAQDLVDILEDGTLKDELQARIDEARRQLDAEAQIPSKDANNVITDTSDTTSTSDTTNIATYLIGLGMAVSMLIVLRRKRSN